MGAGTFGSARASSLPLGIIGSICVGAPTARSTGCITMGPVLSAVGRFLGMTVNAQLSFSFANRWRGGGSPLRKTIRLKRQSLLYPLGSVRIMKVS
jgi:hypothetical protein